MTALRYRFVTMAIAVAGCDPVSEPDPWSQEIPLQGTSWRLVAFESTGAISFPIPREQRYVINFVSDTSFTGRTTVNSYGGPNETRYYSGLLAAVCYSATTDRKPKHLRIYDSTGSESLSFIGE